MLTLSYGTGGNSIIGDNGNLQSQTIAVPTLTNTQTYIYDGVNRLSTFSENGSVLRGYSYDTAGIGYGHRWISSGAFLPYSTQTPQSNSFANNQWAPGSNGTAVDEIEAVKFPEFNKAQQLSIGCAHLQ